MTRRCFLAAPADPTAGQLRWAAVLEFGPPARLGGVAGLIESGWRGEAGPVADVIVPRGARTRPVPEWVRMRTTHHPDHGPAAGTPRAGVARCAVNAASWAHSDRAAWHILLSVLQQRLTTTARVEEQITLLRTPARSRLMRQALQEFHRGSTTIDEVAFVRLCRQYGLPPPVLQTRRRIGQRTIVTDAELRTSRGRLVVVEVDGVGHADVRTWSEDLDRHNVLADSLDAIVLRVSNWTLRHDPDRFMRRLISVLASR